MRMVEPVTTTNTTTKKTHERNNRRKSNLFKNTHNETNEQTKFLFFARCVWKKYLQDSNKFVHTLYASIYTCVRVCVCIIHACTQTLATISNEQIFICFLLFAQTVLLFSHFFFHPLSLCYICFCTVCEWVPCCCYLLLIYRHRLNSEYRLISTALINTHIFTWKNSMVVVVLGRGCFWRCRRYFFLPLALSLIYGHLFWLCSSTHFEIQKYSDFASRQIRKKKKTNSQR